MILSGNAQFDLARSCFRQRRCRGSLRRMALLVEEKSDIAACHSERRVFALAVRSTNPAFTRFKTVCFERPISRLAVASEIISSIGDVVVLLVMVAYPIQTLLAGCNIFSMHALVRVPPRLVVQVGPGPAVFGAAALPLAREHGPIHVCLLDAWSMRVDERTTPFAADRLSS